ncbi:MAG: hypothetical protein R3202_06795 [Candidatus Competibacterales bacterium]|nr:hypothetical protein [Candidatus Competibacterales bacterium]
MHEFLTALQATPLAEVLRLGRWVYPFVNAGHIIGVALLFGAILPLDLRLLGCWPTVAVRPLARVLVPVAATGLALACATGALLFLTDPPGYAAMTLFRLKLALIGAGLLNVLWVHRSRAWRRVVDESVAPQRGSSLRLAGAVSALSWLAVLLCGRLIAYV